jgi:microcin C transport system substrate-binding protein
MVSRAFAAVLAIALSATASAALAENQTSDGMERHHGLSLITPEPQLPPDFPHFPYANPDAPKGGEVRLPAIGSFDTLNPIPLKGTKASGLGLLYEQLMTNSLDEPSAEYGLIAEWMSYPEDYSSVTFGLNPKARWHDGEPITPEDVVFSFDVLKENNPFYAAYYANVTSAEQTGEREVTFRFDTTGNRELPLIVGQMLVFPKHYWDGSENQDPASTTLEPPLGSGPYRIVEAEGGRRVSYERVEDYWAKDLPTRKGQYNFGRVEYEYFRDTTVAFEAFKAGKLDFYVESSAKNWAQGYDFPAKNRGDVIKRTVELDTPQPMQAFVFNTRRDRFADPRVRRAFNYAFDFEWANKNLFFGQYARTDSYFKNTQMESQGVPEGREREILERLRAEYPEHVPEEVLTKDYKNPEGGGRRAMRGNLRKALSLLSEAGWESEGGQLVNAETGERFEVEFLLNSPAMERVVLPYSQTLERLGIDVSMRVVDSSQYQERENTFDFDVIVDSFRQSNSPGNEQRDFWGSQAAETPGSRNTIGIQNPAVDDLIDQIVFAKDRDELVAAARALDRVLLWNHYVVPQWYSPAQRIAYWDKYDHPQPLPSRALGLTQVWWYAPDGGNASATQ